jgi:hypothetical protein
MKATIRAGLAGGSVGALLVTGIQRLRLVVTGVIPLFVTAYQNAFGPAAAWVARSGGCCLRSPCPTPRS